MPHGIEPSRGWFDISPFRQTAATGTRGRQCEKRPTWSYYRAVFLVRFLCLVLIHSKGGERCASEEQKAAGEETQRAAATDTAVDRDRCGADLRGVRVVHRGAEMD